MWRTTTTGKVLLSQEVLTYRDQVALALHAQRVPRTAAAEPLAITIGVHPHTLGTYRARDLDNVLKAVLDALTHARVFADDRWLDEILIRRGDVHPLGELHVALRACAVV